jgi:hypothetical protein
MSDLHARIKLSEISCEDCIYYDKFETHQYGSYGSCRVNPPVLIPGHKDEDGYQSLSGFWPHVDSEFWCGKFEKA